MIKSAAVALVGIISLPALQTRIKVSQIFESSSGSPRVVGIQSSGIVIPYILGPGLVINGTTIDVASPSAVITMKRESLVPSVSNSLSFALSTTPTSLLVFRHGILMKPIDDYNLVGNNVIFTSHYLPDSAPKIEAIYW